MLPSLRRTVLTVSSSLRARAVHTTARSSTDANYLTKADTPQYDFLKLKNDIFTEHSTPKVRRAPPKKVAFLPKVTEDEQVVPQYVLSYLSAMRESLRWPHFHARISSIFTPYFILGGLAHFWFESARLPASGKSPRASRMEFLPVDNISSQKVLEEQSFTLLPSTLRACKR